MSDIPLERPYTPEYVESRLKEAGFWRAVWRILQIASVLVAGLWWRVVDRWSWTYRHGETKEDRQRRRAEWLLDRLIWLGPTFVKVGQALGTRPDLLPLAYIETLATLHDQLPSFPNETAYAFIKEELGWKPETLFAEFGPDPVRRLAALLERFPWLSRRQELVSLVDEFGGKLFEELDYVHEAHLTERFRANFEGLPGVGAPRVYWEFSSRRVLTTEYIEGIKVTDKVRLEAAGVDIMQLLRQGTRANLAQLFEHGLFHADPHPGNLLVESESGTLVFLDFGMMSIIKDDQKLRMIEIFIDVINNRPENLRDNLVALGFLEPDAPWNEILPLAADLFASIFGREDKRVTFQDTTRAFSPLLFDYQFRIPVEFAFIVRSIVTLEGVALQLDPEFDIWAVSGPYAARMMLTFPDPDIRERLMAELLTDDGSLDWQRIQDLAALAQRDDGFRLSTEGLVEPALDMLLSPEGADLRRALMADLLKDPEAAADRVEHLAPLISSDRSLSGRAILDKVIAFLLSPEGEETRTQLAGGLRANGSGSPDLTRLLALSSLAGQLHPDFGPSAMLSAVGSYLLSSEGKPARNQLLAAGAQWVIGGIVGALGSLARPVPPPAPRPALVKAE